MNQNLKLTFSKTLLQQAALVGLVVFSSATAFGNSCGPKSAHLPSG